MGLARQAGDWAFKAFTAGLGLATIYLGATFSVNVYRGLSWHNAQSVYMDLVPSLVCPFVTYSNIGGSWVSLLQKNSSTLNIGFAGTTHKLKLEMLYTKLPCLP